MSAKLVLPDSNEWDFRAIDDSALPSATLYEYARSTVGLRKRLVSWLDIKLAGKKIRSHILDALIAAQKDGKRGSLAHTYYPRVLGNKIAELGWKTGCDLRLLEIIERSRPDFPAPWLAFPIRYKKNPRFSRIMCEPLEDSTRRMHEVTNGTKLDPFDLFERGHATPRRHFLLKIDWQNNSFQDIEADVKRWLKEEAQKHPEMRGRGKPSQAPTEPLKWLAAYRLSKAGLIFEQAQAEMKSSHPIQRDGKREMLPLFSDKRDWCEAIARAEQRLASLSKN